MKYQKPHLVKSAYHTEHADAKFTKQRKADIVDERAHFCGCRSAVNSLLAAYMLQSSKGIVRATALVCRTTLHQ